MKLTKEQILGITRHALTFVGGILVMKGLVDETTVTEIIGGVITLAGTIWSVIDKNKA
jgi:glucose uptake protein GlcU